MNGRDRVAAALGLLAAVGLALLLLPSQHGATQGGIAAAQTPPTLVGMDTDTDGNSAESLGVPDSCISVDVAEIFPVDVYVEEVDDLLAWEVYLQYDQSRLEIVSKDVRLFLSSSPGSNVVDVSDLLPSRSGLYRLAAADIATPAALDSGSGVLARLVLQAKEAGDTSIRLPHLDFNGDYVYDLGPRLIGPGGEEIGDNDGDGFFDQKPDAVRVAVGSSCDSAGAPPGDAGDDADGDGVPDAIDICPDTAPGATVDANGCSAEQRQQTEEQAGEEVLTGAVAGLNLDVVLDTVTAGGSTNVLAVFADQNNTPVPGLDVTFKIDRQPGSDASLEGKSEVTKTSDVDGVAKAKLNVGNTPGEIVVSATAQGETQTVTVTVVATPAGDSDGDGVPDANDQCPGTPAGDSVDASGCSAGQLEQLKEETREVLIESATAHMNLDVTLDTVAVGGSTDVLALFADGDDNPVSGMDVTFKIDQQPGSNANLDGQTSVTKTSAADGVAEAQLNVGDTPGEIVVSATAQGETETVAVTVTADTVFMMGGTSTTLGTSGENEGATTTPGPETEDTPEAGSLSESDDPGGGISVLTWIAASIGTVGALGLLLVLAALRQTRRHNI